MSDTTLMLGPIIFQGFELPSDIGFGGTQLVAVATERARTAGCRWLHVDFEPAHRSFYLDACGFDVTSAGLLDLRSSRT